MITIEDIGTLDIGEVVGVEALNALKALTKKELTDAYTYDTMIIKEMRDEFAISQFFVDYKGAFQKLLNKEIGPGDFKCLIYDSLSWSNISSRAIQFKIYYDFNKKKIVFSPVFNQTILMGSFRQINYDDFKSKHNLEIYKYIFGMITSDELFDYFMKLFIKKAKTRPKEFFSERMNKSDAIRNGENILELVTDISRISRYMYSLVSWSNLRYESIKSLLYFMNDTDYKIKYTVFDSIYERRKEIGEDMIIESFNNLRINDKEWFKAHIENYSEYDDFKESFFKYITGDNYVYISDINVVFKSNPNYVTKFYDDYEIKNTFDLYTFINKHYDLYTFINKHYVNDSNSANISSDIKRRIIPFVLGINNRLTGYSENDTQELFELASEIIDNYLEDEDILKIQTYEFNNQRDLDIMKQALNLFNKDLDKNKIYRGRLNTESVEDLKSKLVIA